MVLGDPHGAHKAMAQVLQRSNFNYQEDTLICLGDVADGWSQVPECFDELLKIKNLIYIMGNHDAWLLDWFKTGVKQHIHMSQGGQASFDAYNKDYNMGNFDRARNHENLLKKALSHYIDKNNNLFIHGGFDWKHDIKDHSGYEMMWDRHLFYTAVYWQHLIDKDDPLLNTDDLRIKQFNEVFIGHTSTSRHNTDLKPVHVSNVWNLDQGCGWEGKLTIMNTETKEYWQSDLCSELYPDEKRK